MLSANYVLAIKLLLCVRVCVDPCGQYLHGDTQTVLKARALFVRAKARNTHLRITRPCYTTPQHEAPCYTTPQRDTQGRCYTTPATHDSAAEFTA